MRKYHHHSLVLLLKFISTFLPLSLLGLTRKMCHYFSHGNSTAVDVSYFPCRRNTFVLHIRFREQDTLHPSQSESFAKSTNVAPKLLLNILVPFHIFQSFSKPTVFPDFGFVLSLLIIFFIFISVFPSVILKLFPSFFSFCSVLLYPATIFLIVFFSSR